MQRSAFAERHAHDAALGGLGRLTDRLRHFARLAVAVADAALLVADDDERGEAEATAALHHLRHAVDVDELIDKFAVALLPVVPAAAAAILTSHNVSPSLARELRSRSLWVQKSRPPSRAPSASALTRP